MTGGSGETALRLLIADDQELVRVGFRMILESEGLIVVGEAADGVEAIALAASLHPEVVLMDIRMPHLDGIEATRRIVTELDPAPRVLALTTFDVDESVHAAIQAGASGYMLKGISPAGLVHGVRAVAAGEALLAPSIVTRLMKDFGARGARQASASASLGSLSERERDVLVLVARGLSNSEIAADLFLSEATVKAHVSRLYTKLAARDRVRLAILAYESGLVRAGD